MKIFRFWNLCYLYIMSFPLMLLMMILYAILGFFIFVYGNDIIKPFYDFSEKLNKIITSKIDNIKKYEFNLLNKDINEKCKNGEYGLRLKNVSWKIEICETIIIIMAVVLIILNI